MAEEGSLCTELGGVRIGAPGWRTNCRRESGSERPKEFRTIFANLRLRLAYVSLPVEAGPREGR